MIRLLVKIKAKYALHVFGLKLNFRLGTCFPNVILYAECCLLVEIVYYVLCYQFDVSFEHLLVKL